MPVCSVGSYTKVEGIAGPPPPTAGRPGNALRSVGAGGGGGEGAQGPGTRLVFRVRAAETQGDRHRGSAGGNLLRDLLVHSQDVAQRRDGGGRWTTATSDIGRGASPALDHCAPSRQGEDSGGGVSHKEKALDLGGGGMAAAQQQRSASDCMRRELEASIPSEMLCPITRFVSGTRMLPVSQGMVLRIRACRASFLFFLASSSSTVTCKVLFRSDIMRDPVICTDGHTYERAAAAEWLKRKAVSPLTNQPLAQPVLLIPNHALRSLISDFVQRHGGWEAFAL